MPRRTALVGLVLALICLAGCDSRNGGNVSGTVKFGGKLATSGTVMIENEQGLAATGVINRDGTYTVVKPPRGKCKVMVRRGPPVKENTGPPDPNSSGSSSGPAEEDFPIPEKYASKKTTDIEITVGGDSQTLDIDKSDKSEPGSGSSPKMPPPTGGLGGPKPGGGGIGKPGAVGKPGGGGPGMPGGSGMPKKQ